jgi:hypothetical protein
LKRQWEEWTNRGSAGAIARADCDKTGGRPEAIAQDAGSVMEGLTHPEREAVKRVYRRITEKGTGDMEFDLQSFAVLVLRANRA